MQPGLGLKVGNVGAAGVIWEKRDLPLRESLHVSSGLTWHSPTIVAHSHARGIHVVL
jgi:hypothetical protein